MGQPLKTEIPQKGDNNKGQRDRLRATNDNDYTPEQPTGKMERQSALFSTQNERTPFRLKQRMVDNQSKELMQMPGTFQDSAQQSQQKLEKVYFQKPLNQPVIAIQDHQTKIKVQSSENRLIAPKQETPSSQNLFIKQSGNDSSDHSKNENLKTHDVSLTDKKQILSNLNRQSNSKLSQQGASQTPSKKTGVFTEIEKESIGLQQRNQRTQSRTQNINHPFAQQKPVENETFSQSGSLGFLKETPGYTNQFRQASFSSQQNHRNKKINNHESCDNNNIQKSAQHMKFIQNYSNEHYQQDTSPQTVNLMSYQVKKQNQNTIQLEENEHTPGKPHKNRSKNFFKLDRGFGETSSSNGVASNQFVPKSQMVAAHASPYIVNGQKQDSAEYQMSKQRQLNASKQMQAQDQNKKLSQYQQFKINENINFQQFSTYLSNFVNSEKYLKLQEKFSDSGKASKALILTPWNEKQTTSEQEKMKQLSQFMQMSQISQNGLRLNSQSQDGHNKANMQKQQAMFQSQLKNILQKIIGGSRNEQFLQQSSNLLKMGLSPEISNLTEEQVWTILGNYFKEQMPSSQIRSASSQHNSSYVHKAPTSDTINVSIMTDESVLTKEQKRYLKKQKKQMSQINDQSERRIVQVKDQKAQSRERFCISGQSGDNMRLIDNKLGEVHSIAATPGLSMFGQPQTSVGQSPANQTQQAPQPTQTFVNRQKFVKKFQNNIHIIDDAEKRQPYDGLFNLNGKQISQTQTAMRDGDGVMKAEAYKHTKEEKQQQQQIKMKEHTSIDHNQVQTTKGAFKSTVRSKAELQQEAMTPAPAAQAGNAHYKMAQQSNKTMERRGAATEKRQNPSTTDFDIEYAKLIAKQFPIYDPKGKLIDYSNINEFQLELLALHEEYGEEKDPKIKIRIFQQLSSINEEEFYEKKRQAKLKTEQNKHHHDRIPGDNSGQDETQKNFLKKGIFTKKPYGKNVGKEGGNPEYRKTVIQLENERIERERQEILVKRKRNSNYIQQCIKHGNEHYDQQKLNGLSWLKKPKPQEEEEKASIQSKLDEKNLELLRKKQEILAKYNQFSKQNAPQFADDGLCRVSFVKGNNSKLVKQVLLTRDHWAELEQQHNTLYQFKWAPVSRFINFEQLGAHGQKKIVNHLEKHELLTTKDQIYTNMHRFCEHEKLNVFQYLPIQFVIDLSAKNCLQEIDKFCQFFNSIERVKKQNTITIDEQIAQINSHIAQNKAIQAESKYKGMINRKFDLDDQMYQGGNVWLIKPNDFNRGRGVKLFNTLDQLRKLMKEFSNGNEMDFYFHNVCCQILANEKALNNQCKGVDDAILKEQVIEPQIESEKKERAENFLTAGVTSDVFVIQKYIEQPLLIDQRKFDIRLWVLVDCCDLKDQKCYLFKEGYIRTSCHQFTLSQESIDQPFIHLTNNAVQQYDENYGKLEEGNQLSFEKAAQIIKEQTGKEVDFYELLHGGILDIIKMTFKCVDHHKLNPNQKKHQFEIFGYDFMIDSDLRPWLIEINTNPCLEETSKLLRSLLPRMLNDAFKLTLDVLFPRPKTESDTIQQGQTEPPQQFSVENHNDNENMWEHIYSLKPQ